MSGAHADIEAVFDYAPDAKLLAAAQADDWNDDDAGQSGITDGSNSNNTRDFRRNSASSKTNQQYDDESDIEEANSEASASTDADDAPHPAGTSTSPVIARDTLGLGSYSQPAGILSSSPERTRTMATQITFDSASRRRSYPPIAPQIGSGAGNVPEPKQKESPSVLQRLYGPVGTQESNGTRAGGWDATPPSWVLELNATLRGIEERQRHLEQILGGAKDPDSASVTSAIDEDED